MPARWIGSRRHVAVTIAGCLLLLTTPQSGVPASSLVIITLDTTRADRLSPYGFMNVALPHLERLAKEGVLFDDAVSVAPLTLPAHSSLFTGLLPPNHGVRDNADPPLADGYTTLAEVLRARGFRTAASVGSVVLDGTRGLRQGFEAYRDVQPASASRHGVRQRRGDQVVTDALDWLGAIGGSRFFLWVHLYDPHWPYDPPEPYRSAYAHDPYVGEIAFADAQIGRLLAFLDSEALLDDTLVVVAADHGESLGERGEQRHGMLLYENVLRVPLILRIPGVRPSRVPHLVRLIDVMPTVLDLLGLPGASAGDGRSFAAVVHGRSGREALEAYSESVYAERLGCGPLRSLRRSRFKLIDGVRPELYDLELDPFELRNISAQHPHLAQAMSARIHLLTRGDAPIAASPVKVPADLRARLAALGYVGGGEGRSNPAAVARGRRECVAQTGS
jgi:arylsulfatase A-like enzyme